ncbi:acyltransferase [Methylobacterium sp. 77]|uniref:acyltransferase family protein n=1 Tax=Methylobacterium sp. 77 TaxID=1101192 RepID=UPI00038181A5|nr:acyltransferase [Methylobacterium sp. 77]
MVNAAGNSAGFDYLRIGLSVSVVIWHSYSVANFDESVRLFWGGPYRALSAAILPMFFALSGFLVAGSLGRTRLHQFALLRLLRIVPALAFETVLVALVLGPLFTVLPLSVYFSSPELYSYFFNIVGYIHYTLPGVIGGQMLNAQLWTIPTELECYLALIGLAFVGATRRRALFGGGLVLVVLGLTAFSIGAGDQSPYAQLGGRVLIFSFLAGVLAYLYRDLIPHDGRLFVASLLLSALLLTYRETSYLAAFPIAYVTVWLGVTNLRRIPFGDLSYGVFLFHFPIIKLSYEIFGDRLTSPGYFAIALPLSLACAWVSWTFIEKPVLDHKKQIIAWIEKSAASLRGAVPTPKSSDAAT